MSIPVALRNLADAARERGPAAYVLTVDDRGAPHVVHAEVAERGVDLVARIGERTALNARARPMVSLLYPCRGGEDYSLIVDGHASVEAAPDGYRLSLTPTRAVLHRPASPAPDPAVSPCGSDCVPLALRAQR